MKTTTTAHQRWLRKLARDTDRKRMTAARAKVREARTAKKTARARAKVACNRARAVFKRWVAHQRKMLKKRIEELRKQLRERIATQRERLRACCGKEARAKARATSDERIQAARAELDQLLAEKRRERVWSRKDPHAAPIATRSEKKSEADHEVEVNLTADELIVWQRVKNKIQGSDRMSRTEAFRHYVHDNSADVARFIIEDAERGYQEAIANERAEREAQRGTRTDAELARLVVEELGHLPSPPLKKRRPVAGQVGKRKAPIKRAGKVRVKKPAKPPSAYEQRQQARRQRLARAAATRSSKAHGRLATARGIADAIPMGQPILVGHHSERRHRRDLERHDANMRKGVGLLKEAERLERAAASVGRGGIASDDPEALVKLREKLRDLEATQASMKRLNAIAAKGGGIHAALAVADHDERKAIEHNVRFAPGGTDKPFPSFKLTNNNAEIRRVLARIEALEALTATEDRTLEGNGWSIREDSEQGRTLIAFSTRQPDEIVKALKGNGWRWSRVSSAWTRKRTGAAWHDAVRLSSLWSRAKPAAPPPPAAPAATPAKATKRATKAKPKTVDQHVGQRVDIDVSDETKLGIERLVLPCSRPQPVGYFQVYGKYTYRGETLDVEIRDRATILHLGNDTTIVSLDNARVTPRQLMRKCRDEVELRRKAAAMTSERKSKQAAGPRTVLDWFQSDRTMHAVRGTEAIELVAGERDGSYISSKGVRYKFDVYKQELSIGGGKYVLRLYRSPAVYESIGYAEELTPVQAMARFKKLATEWERASKPKRAASSSRPMRYTSKEAKEKIRLGDSWVIDDPRLGRIEWNGYSGRFSRGDQWGEIVAPTGLGPAAYELAEWRSGSRWRLPNGAVTPANLLRWAHIASERGGPLHNNDEKIPRILSSLKSKQREGSDRHTYDHMVTWDPSEEQGIYRWPHMRHDESGRIALDTRTGLLELIAHRDGRTGVWQLGHPDLLTFPGLVDRVRRAMQRPADSSASKSMAVPF